MERERRDGCSRGGYSRGRKFLGRVWCLEGGGRVGWGDVLFFGDWEGGRWVDLGRWEKF